MSDVPQPWDKEQYQGFMSTLCTGCGHDSITQNIIKAYYESQIAPHDIAKVSGIGCSSKTPTYFLGQAHGFNSLHGRMAPVATGIACAHKDINIIGVSGDGDTASIGLGGFAHLIRRNVPMVYIVENNGVYGLTKGQFSATADSGSTIKNNVNEQLPIDLCALALSLGCDFVARSFSGDPKQLTPLISAAIRHQGTAFIDVISPCITFANNEGSTKSFKHLKAHKNPLQEFGFIQPQEEVTVDYKEGDTEVITLADGSQLTLKKLDSQKHDVHSRSEALTLVQNNQTTTASPTVLTGLFYINPQTQNLSTQLNLTSQPLRDLTQEDLQPSAKSLEKIQKEFR